MMTTNPPQPPGGSAVEKVDAKALRVLVVEDDPSICRALGRWLRSAGIQHRFASTLREALQLLDACDAALLDLDLPDGCGTGFLQAVRRGALPIRVAVCSGRVDARAIVSASGERPDAMFAKPLDLELILAWVAKKAKG
jgi:DNA-binding NtrC family response regulator